jgi:hypothetical protein
VHQVGHYPELLYCLVVLITMNQLRMFYRLGGARGLYHEFGNAGSEETILIYFKQTSGWGLSLHNAFQPSECQQQHSSS